MSKLTFLLCIYCATIGTALWLIFFVTLWSIVHALKNRYNLSVPRIVIDKVDKHFSEESNSLILEDKKKTTRIAFDKKTMPKMDVTMV